MEAFSDGVLAVIITVMVLEMKSPRGATLTALSPLIPVFLTYILSFVYVGIYWNNHHHLLHATQRVNGTILWANLHLLFWLSLIPFTTAWMGENHFESLPVAVYGVVLLLAGVAYFILTRALIKLHGQDSTLATTGVHQAVDCGCLLCRRCHHVADPRPAHREKAGAQCRYTPQCRRVNDQFREPAV